MDAMKKAMSAIEKAENSDKVFSPYELFGIEIGLGWYGLLLPVIKEIDDYNKLNPDNKITIEQIKEKFGTLRIYASGCPDYIKKMIIKAEDESAHICEFCGVRCKTVQINNWYWTLCKKHAKEKQEEYDSGVNVVKSMLILNELEQYVNEKEKKMG
uniref:Uncharacterized protein n=1 Tax=uncultured bacterium contig00019 TaxID=1181510 RepID=A0A806KJ58_9BACT|nr:hypothetical protein [uncultured bacterium contig00019]